MIKKKVKNYFLSVIDIEDEWRKSFFKGTNQSIRISNLVSQIINTGKSSILMRCFTFQVSQKKKA